MKFLTHSLWVGSANYVGPVYVPKHIAHTRRKARALVFAYLRSMGYNVRPKDVRIMETIEIYGMASTRKKKEVIK